MKSFVYIALAVLLGTVQGYGPKINRNKIGGSRFHNGSPHSPPQGPHHGPPYKPQHGPPHRPPLHGFGPHRLPPNQKGDWDDSPIWDDRSDSRDSSGGGFDSYDSSDSYDSYSGDKDRSGGFDSSYEDSDYWHDYHHTKRPCTNKPTTSRRPIITKKPATPKPTAPKPITPKPTTPKPTTPKPTTPKPITPKPTTPEPIPETTPTVPETTTTEEGLTSMSPNIANCIQSCASTPEYNPVCGSDGQTYDNEGKLFCARSCGVNVTLQRRSVCPVIPDGGDFTTDTLPPTITATTPNIGRTTPLPDFTRCMRQCRITPSFTPVCGTDNVTYMNMDRLKCAQSCGEVVQVLCEKPCAACGFNPGTTPSRPTTTTLLPTTPQIGRTTPDLDIQQCIKACPVTSEYNPVCGSDRVTYNNPGRLLCAQICGVGVAVSRLGPCGLSTTTSETTVAPSTTLSPEIRSCIRRCPVTSEYEPVCGTDNLTYSNFGNLYCARFCGVDVDVKQKSRCIDEFDLDILGTDSTPSQTTQNINGFKETTSRNTATSPMTPISTVMPPTPTTKVTTDPGSNSSSTVGFTIPEEVLKEIFGSTTTQAPTTKPTNPDEDEDLDLDARFNVEKPTEESS